MMDKKKISRALNIVRWILWVLLVIEVVLWITGVNGPSGVIPTAMLVVTLIKAWVDK